MSYLSHYPPAQSDTYVKATSYYTNFHAYTATNPSTSLTGDWNNNWLATLYTVTNQRFHIDLGSAKQVNRIYYENFHDSGAETDYGVKNFTLWGSNTAGSFSELTYGTDSGWTQLTTSQATFDQHAASDAADPKYITVTNEVAYRYYAFKFADNWGDANLMGVRRIELQTYQAGILNNSFETGTLDNWTQTPENSGSDSTKTTGWGTPTGG